MNGLHFNGLNFNGLAMNGLHFNGLAMNGLIPNSILVAFDHLKLDMVKMGRLQADCLTHLGQSLFFRGNCISLVRHIDAFKRLSMVKKLGCQVLPTTLPL